MKQLVILATLFRFAWGVRVPDETNTRVISGTPAAPGQFPYAVSLRYSENANLECGGSIIHPKWILTAGHCVPETNPKKWFVVVGTTFYSVNVSDLLGARHELAKIILHENFRYIQNGTHIDINNDIALLQLKIPVTLSNRVQVIKLNRRPVDEISATSVGWGLISYPKPIGSFILLSLQMQVIPQNVCKAKIYFGRLYDGFLCAFGGLGKGLCSGDSGGPLVDQNGQQVGINSWAALPCAIGEPDVFLRISAYYDWIKKRVNLL